MCKKILNILFCVYVITIIKTEWKSFTIFTVTAAQQLNSKNLSYRICANAQKQKKKSIETINSPIQYNKNELQNENT